MRVVALHSSSFFSAAAYSGKCSKSAESGHSCCSRQNEPFGNHTRTQIQHFFCCCCLNLGRELFAVNNLRGRRNLRALSPPRVRNFTLVVNIFWTEICQHFLFSFWTGAGSRSTDWVHVSAIFLAAKTTNCKHEFFTCNFYSVCGGHVPIPVSNWGTMQEGGRQEKSTTHAKSFRPFGEANFKTFSHCLCQEEIDFHTPRCPFLGLTLGFSPDFYCCVQEFPTHSIFLK